MIKPTYSLEDLERWAAEVGGKCLSGDYHGVNNKHSWMCKRGHTFDLRPTFVRQGAWCPQCTREEKKAEKLDKMKEFAVNHEGKCLSGEYSGCMKLLSWECKNGHRFDASPNRMQQRKTFCPLCARITTRITRQQIEFEKARKFAAKNGAKCLSELYSKDRSKLEWICKKGHKFSASFASSKARLNFCSQCYKEEIKEKNLKMLRQIAKSKGGHCLSDVFIDTHTKLEFECRLGHRWKSTPFGIIQDKTWCPSCGGKKKLTIKNIHARAAQLNWTFVSKTYTDRRKLHEWKCQKGHRFKMTPARVLTQGKCPGCRELRKKEKALILMRKWALKRGGRCLSKKYIDNETKLIWECENGHQFRMTRDAYKQKKESCEECKREAARQKKLKAMQKLGEKKGGRCLSKKYLGLDQEIRFECKKGHRWTAKPHYIIYANSWCPQCQPNKKLSLGDIQRMALKKGGKCISTKYVNSSTPMKWKCSEDHVWTTPAYNIRAGTWCPVCSGRYKYKIEDMQKLAAEKNGECLSKIYVQSLSKLEWRCEQGHEWAAVPSSVVRGSWCPHCTGRARYTIEKMNEAAKEHGGKCLSEKYVNSKMRLHWECKNGHRWEAVPQGIMVGQWCPECAGVEPRYPLS